MAAGSNPFGIQVLADLGDDMEQLIVDVAVRNQVTVRDLSTVFVTKGVAVEVSGAAASFLDDKRHRECFQARRAHEDAGIELAGSDQSAENGD